MHHHISTSHDLLDFVFLPCCNSRCNCTRFPVHLKVYEYIKNHYGFNFALKCPQKRRCRLLYSRCYILPPLYYVIELATGNLAFSFNTGLHVRVLYDTSRHAKPCYITGLKIWFCISACVSSC